MGGAYDHFFDTMEDLGYFDHIYEDLPEDFTAVFEIARILEDENCEITRKLLPVLKLQAPSDTKREEEAAESPQVFVTEAEEYEAGLIRSPQHLPRIYNSQWLLPDEVFYRKLAKKELWVPYAREPRYFGVDPESDDYRPDRRKQKLYVLLDTSSSMAMKNRINLAKAVVYHFLKHNMRELGFISLRTFDERIGELHEAKDTASFHALISYVMRLHTLGNGTAMAKAIRQAVDDINAMPQLSGTEILIITDGACALDEAEMRGLLGDEIVIHTVKIGRMELIASKSYIHDKIFEEDTSQHRLVGNLVKREAELRHMHDTAESPALRRRYGDSLRAIRQELDRQVNAMTEEIVVGYGHELERLSQLYITVDDMDLPSLFEFRIDQLQELQESFARIVDDIEMYCSVDKLRRLALLHDHLSVLIKNTRDPEMRKQLEDLQRRIEKQLTECMKAQLEGTTAGSVLRMSGEDLHDLTFLLSGSGGLHLGLWKALLWRLIRVLKLRRA